MGLNFIHTSPKLNRPSVKPDSTTGGIDDHGTSIGLLCLRPVAPEGPSAPLRPAVAGTSPTTAPSPATPPPPPPLPPPSPTATTGDVDGEGIPLKIPPISSTLTTRPPTGDGSGVGVGGGAIGIGGGCGPRKTITEAAANTRSSMDATMSPARGPRSMDGFSCAGTAHGCGRRS